MNNILIPTDFSDCASAASDYAIKLARLANARLHFVHFQSTPVEWIKVPKEEEGKHPETVKAIGHSKLALSEWISKAEHKGVKAERFLIFDADNNQLTDYIKKHNYDLIIMGSHGSNGMFEKMMGSNTQQVLRNVEVPLLIIKASVPDPVKRILFVSDFTDISKDSFLSLTHLADVLESSIELLFVNTPDNFKASKEVLENMNAVTAHSRRKEKGVKNVVDAASIEDGIRDFIAKRPVDIIAICTHGKGDFRQLFSPSIAEKVVGFSELPVLSIKL